MGNKMPGAVRNHESAAAEAAVSSSECLPEPVKETFKQYASLINYLCHVEDADIWANGPHEVLWKQAPLQQLLASGPSTHLHVLLNGTVGLLAQAAVNIMGLISRKAESAPTDVLECRTACAVLQGLLRDTCQLLDAEMLSKPEWVCGVHQQLLQQLAVSGVLPTLVSFFQSIISALQQLAGTADCFLEKQQMPDAADVARLLQQHSEAALLVAQTLVTCCRLFFGSLNVTTMVWLPSYFSSAVTATAHLTAVAVPLLSKGMKLAEHSAKAASKDSDMLKIHRDVLRLAMQNVFDGVESYRLYIAVVVPLVAGDWHIPAYDGVKCKPQHLQKKQQEILLAEKLPEFLLIQLSFQAAQLHSLCSKEVHSSAAAAAEAGQHRSHPAGVSQQQLQQQCSNKHQGILNSQNDLLFSLGFQGPQPDKVFPSFKFCMRTCQWIVRTIRRAIIQRKQATVLCSSSSSNSSSARGANQECQQQYYCRLQGSWCNVFPARLVSPAVRTLLEIVLLLPADEISTRAECLLLVMTLLNLPAPATLGDPHPPRLSAADEFKANTADVNDCCLYPALPAAAAAGLLKPVLQLLSRVVILALHNTYPLLRQQQGNPAAGAADTTVLAEDRRLLLHQYARLLITVCQAVAAKHITAALRSDPLFPLVAIEAVVRAQAELPNCPIAKIPLEPQMQREKQHQQQSDPAAKAGHTSADSARGAASLRTCDSRSKQYSRCHSAQQLMPFLMKAAKAAVDMLQAARPDVLHTRQMSIDGSMQDNWQSYAALCQRTFSLLTTACKVAHVTEVAEPCANLQAASSGPDQHTCVAGKSAIVRDVAAPSSELSVWYNQGMSEIASGLTLALKDTIIGSCDQVHSGQVDTCTKATACDRSSATVKADSSVRSAESLAWRHFHDLLVNMHLRMLQACAQRLQSRILILRSSTTVEIVWDGSIQLAAGSGCSTSIPHCLMDVQGCLQTVTRITTALHDVLKHVQQVWRPAQLVQLHQLHLDAESALHVFDQVAPCLNAQQHESPADACVNLPSQPAWQLWNKVRSLCCELQQIVPQLLAECPVPFSCNNPSCLNLSKLSEYQLVSGKACVCGGCKVARYCSRECQKQHRKPHKRVCQAHLGHDDYDEFMSVVSDVEWFDC